MNVFVTDSGTKHSLAVVRGLGKENVTVYAGGTGGKYHLAFLSKYVTKRISYPESKEEFTFIRGMKRIIEKYKLSAILPVSFQSNYLFSKHLNKLNRNLIPVTSFPKYKIAAHKNLTMNYCQDNDFPVLKTFFPESKDELRIIAKEATFPLVVKSPVESGSVRYVHNEQELIHSFKRLKLYGKLHYSNTYPIVQEYLFGEGYGFFALFNQGDPRAIFCHHRVHEYPITGGPSSKAESYYNKNMVSIGMRLLKSLEWHGVAMVEFKRSAETGKFKIIEINPKFWGSLDLAIASGVNFPFLTAKMVSEGDISKQFHYNLKTSFRWLFYEDILHFLAREDKKRGLKEFIMDFGNQNSHSDINLGDPNPILLRLISTLRILYQNPWINRYPHGNPYIDNQS